MASVGSERLCAMGGGLPVDNKIRNIWECYTLSIWRDFATTPWQSLHASVRESDLTYAGICGISSLCFLCFIEKAKNCVCIAFGHVTIMYFTNNGFWNCRTSRMKICHVESELLAAAHVKELMFQNHLVSAKRNSERKDHHLFFIFIWIIPTTP